MGYTQAGWAGFTENNEENEGKKVINTCDNSII